MKLSSLGLLLAIGFAALGFCSPSLSQDVPSPTTDDSELLKLDIFASEHFPKAFYFRHPEIHGVKVGTEFEKWDARYSGLQGIMGKVLEEEVPGRNRVLPLFLEWKKKHPTQIMLLHFNGIARNPSFETDRFSAGHWLYFQGATIQQDIGAEEDESVIQVSNHQVFRTDIGRFKRHADDIGICLLGADGLPDWSQSEQVKLLEVLPGSRSIRVQRGAYGTEKKSWKGKQAYAAAHVSNGPWGENSPLLWTYNFSTRCPKNAQGKNCNDALVEDLAHRLLGNGELSTFNGIEFDGTVEDLRWPKELTRSPDCDANGKPDDGWDGNQNHYGRGVDEFFTKLRKALGPGKIIACDGVYVRPIQARSNRLWNGMESEGWPVRLDPTFLEWSSGWNRHAYSRQVTVEPKFNYFNHKFTTRGKEFTLSSSSEYPMSTHRLVMAAAVLGDNVFASAFLVPGASEESTVYWDEMLGGDLQQLGWLGKPIEEVRYVIDESKPNIVDDLIQRNGGSPAKWTIANIQSDSSGTWTVTKAKNDRDLLLRLPKIDSKSTDIVVSMECRVKNAKDEIPMRITARCGSSVRFDPDPLSPEGLQSWVAKDWFPSRFYFSKIAGEASEVLLRFEDLAQLEIRNLAIREGGEHLVRAYEHGLVIANPTPYPWKVDLNNLYPGQKWKRLKGTQDVDANSGKRVEGVVELKGLDALFLHREEK